MSAYSTTSSTVDLLLQPPAMRRSPSNAVSARSYFQTESVSSSSDEHSEAVDGSNLDSETIAEIQATLHEIKLCLAKAEVGFQNLENIRRIREAGDFLMFEDCKNREECEAVMFARGLRTITDGDNIIYTVPTDELDGEEYDSDESSS